jgi:hypothetical protein
VLSLRAVKPHRLRVFDMNSVRQDAFLRAVRGVGGHEAGEEGVGFIGHDVLDWDAGLVEGGLDDGVVLHVLLAGARGGRG